MQTNLTQAYALTHSHKLCEMKSQVSKSMQFLRLDLNEPSVINLTLPLSFQLVYETLHQYTSSARIWRYYLHFLGSIIEWGYPSVASFSESGFPGSLICCLLRTPMTMTEIHRQV